MDDLMKALLSAGLPGTPEKNFEVKRLTRHVGMPFVVQLKALGYDMVAEIRERTANKAEGEAECHILLEAMHYPDPRESALKEMTGAATPIDAIKRLFLPGEIEAMARQVEILSGFRGNNIKEIKKK